MDFAKIIFRSWEIIKKQRYLWWLGLLAVFSEGSMIGNGFSNISQIASQVYSQKTPVSNISGQTVIEKIPQALLHRIIDQASPYLAVIFGISILLFILIIYLSCSARAGLIISVNDAEDNKYEESVINNSAFAKGTPYVWRLFGLDLLIGSVILLALCVIFLPIIFSIAFHYSTAVSALSGILAFIGFFGIIVLALYLGLVSKYASRILVLENTAIFYSIKRGRQLVRNHLKAGILSFLISLAIGFAASMVLSIAILILAALLFGLSLALNSILGSPASPMYALVVGIMVTAIYCIIAGIYTAFSSSYWTITYRAINYLEDKNNINNQGGI